VKPVFLILVVKLVKEKSNLVLNISKLLLHDSCKLLGVSNYRIVTTLTPR